MLSIFEKESGVSGTEGAAEGPDPPVAYVRGAGAGILSGAYRELPHFDEKDIRYTFYPFFKDPMFSDIQCLLKEMDKIAHIHHVPVSHIALNWVTQKDFISASLVGVANQDQAQENSQAFAFSLTDEEMLFLDHAIEKYL